MTGDALICLAKLADHLGLSSLLETAAEALIKLPWEGKMSRLKELLQMSLYNRVTDRRDKLLHHPKRGAYTELQLLDLLKAANTPWSDCASAIDLESLQPSELQALLGVFADVKWDSDFEALLRPALKEQMMPEALRSKLNWAKPVRIIHNIMLPAQRGSNSSVQTIPLPKCDLELQITSQHKEGMAKFIFCHLHKLCHSKVSLCLAFDSFKRGLFKLVLWLCRSGSDWTLPAYLQSALWTHKTQA